MFKLVALFALISVASATNYAYQTVHNPVVYQTAPVVHQPTVYQHTVPAVKTYQTVHHPVVHQTVPVKTYHQTVPVQTYHQTVPVVHQVHHQSPVQTYHQTVPVVAKTYHTVPVAKTYQTVPVVQHHQYQQVVHTPSVVYSAHTVHKPVEQHGYQVAY